MWRPQEEFLFLPSVDQVVCLKKLLVEGRRPKGAVHWLGELGNVGDTLGLLLSVAFCSPAKSD